MKVAALDLGTNTFLCLVVEVLNGKIEKIIEDQVQIVRLGQEVNKTKKFHSEALFRADKCLSDFSKIIQKHNPERILAMATSAARDVTNAEELFKIGLKYNIPIEIIPGEKEAEITYRGSTSGLNNELKNIVVLDIGGGSTELILGKGNKVITSESVNIGCVRLSEMFLNQQPATEAQLTKMEEYIEKELSEIINKIKQNQVDEILAVAGTPTEIARIEIGSFDAQKIDNMKLSKKLLTEKYNLFSSSTVKEIENKHQVSAGRADVITVGVLILKKVCEILNKEYVLVSTRGVRFGVALEVAERKI